MLGQVARYLLLLALLAHVGLHGEQVYDACEVSLRTYWQLECHGLVAIDLLQLGKCLVEVCVLAVHAVDEDHAG